MAINPIVSKAAQAFGLGEIRSIERLGGNANENYLLSVPAGRFVVKIHLEHTQQEIEGEFAYLDYLSHHGLPLPQHLETADGRQIAVIDGAAVTALEYVEGEPTPSSVSAAEQIGQVLARLHVIAPDRLEPRPCWLGKDYLPGNIALVEEHFHKKYAPFREAYEHVRILPHDDLPRSIIHGDVGPNNVVFTAGRLSAILDWEEVSTGAALLDLAETVLDFCFVDDVYQPQLARALLGAYEQVRPLQPIERDNLSLAVRYAGLTWSVWHLLQFGLHNPDPAKLDQYDYYWRRQLSGLVVETVS